MGETEPGRGLREERQLELVPQVPHGGRKNLTPTDCFLSFVPGLAQWLITLVALAEE